MEKNTDILSVCSLDGEVAGINTDWDITRTASQGQLADICVDDIMSRNVIRCGPNESLLDLVLKLEQHNISALPVLAPDGKLLGVITADLLATRTLYRLLLGDEQT